MARHPFILLLLAVGLIASAAGAAVAWLAPDSPAPASVAEANAVYNARGQFLGYELPHSEDVTFSEQLMGLPVPPADLAVTADGTVWVTQFTGVETGHQLIEYRPGAGAVLVHDLPDSPASGLASALSVHPDGRLVLAYGYVAVEFDPRTGKGIRHDLPKVPANFVKNSLEEGSWVTDMDIDSNGTVYIARMNNAAIMLLDLTAGVAKEIPIDKDFGPVWDIAAGQGAVYVSNWFGGPGIMAPKHGKLYLDGRFELLPGSGSSSLASDGVNVYAAGLDGTLSMVAGSESFSPVRSSLLGGKASLAISPDGETIWFAGRDSGTIASVEVRTGRMQTFELPSYAPDVSTVRCVPDAPCHASLAKTRVDGLTVAPNGDVYFSDATLNRIGVIRAGR